jgi:hypothetical protein
MLKSTVIKLDGLRIILILIGFSRKLYDFESFLMLPMAKGA